MFSKDLILLGYLLCLMPYTVQAFDTSKFEAACSDIGFKKKSEPFADCVLELIAREKRANQKIETAKRQAFEVERLKKQRESEAMAVANNNREVERQRLAAIQRRQIDEQNLNQSSGVLDILGKVAKGTLYLGLGAASGYYKGRSSSFSIPASTLPMDTPGNPSYRNDAGSTNTYQSSYGRSYQYDLSNPGDRVRYGTDMDAQRRDELDWNPTRQLEHTIGQHGGGIQR